MRLLIFINSLVGGGAERVVVNLSKAWAARGYDVTVATLASAQQDFYELDSRVARIALDVASPSHNVFDAIRKNGRRISQVRRTILEMNPDVVLSFMTTTNVITLLASIGLRYPVIVSEHTHRGCPTSRGTSVA